MRPIIHILVVFFVFASAGCKTLEFTGYETDKSRAPGKENLTKTPEPLAYAIEVKDVSDEHDAIVTAKISRVERALEKWDEVYPRVSVYRKVCKGYYNANKNCEFATSTFIFSHVILFGFFVFDPFIPFLDYKPSADGYTERRPAGEVSSPRQLEVVLSKAPVDRGTATLEVDGQALEASVAEGVARWKLPIRTIRERPRATVTFGEAQVDASTPVRLAYETLSEKQAVVAQAARDASGCEHLWGYSVVQRLGPGSFEISTPDRVVIGQCHSSEVDGGSFCNPSQTIAGKHAVLITSDTKISSVGPVPVDLFAKDAGTKKLTLVNGFEASVPVFRESRQCKSIMAH